MLTAYPDAVVSRFEAAFEQANPRYRLVCGLAHAPRRVASTCQPGQAGWMCTRARRSRTYAFQPGVEGVLRKLPVAGSGRGRHPGSDDLTGFTPRQRPATALR